MKAFLNALPGYKTYITVTLAAFLLFGSWQHWWTIPPEIYGMLAALVAAFIRAGLTREIAAATSVAAIGAASPATAPVRDTSSPGAAGKVIVGMVAATALFMAGGMLMMGCTKSTIITSTTGTNGVTTLQTNVVTIVNTNEVNIAAKILQGGVTLATRYFASLDTNAIPILQDIGAGLQGALTGNTSGNSIAGAPTALSTATAALNKYVGQNAAVDSFIGLILPEVGVYEQTLVAKFGATIAGEIILPEFQAISDGIAGGLAPAPAH